MSGRVDLIHGNALSLPLADGTVSLVVTSPPYWALRSYRDDGEHYDGQLGSEDSPYGFVVNLWRVMDECWRVLRDDGSCWVNLGDKFAGSGGGNQAGVLAHRNAALEAVHDQRVAAFNAPRRYNQNTAGLRPKSRMLLPHLFAEGCQYPWLRRAVEQQAGIQPTVDPPQWIVRMDAVWSKPNGLPESVQDRVRASHEYLFHLVKSERYYAAIDEVREGFSAVEKRSGAGWLDRSEGNVLGRATDPNCGLRDQERNPLGKVPGSVWTIATEPLILPDHLPQHFAAFPSELPRRIILGWSPSGICTACGEGRRPVCERTKDVYYGAGQFRSGAQQVKDGAAVVGWVQDEKWRTETRITGYACACPTPDAPTRPAVVVDPFSGTGTTAIVAAALGRHGVGVDLSWDYHRIARWRAEDPTLRCKVLGVDKPERELDGQLSLLDGGAA